MSDNGGKIQWLKFFLQALLFLSISARIFAEESGSFIFVSTEPKAPECPPNERWTACLSNCTNCEERGICLVTDCDKGRCECYRNFVRLYPDGPCERVSKCPVNKCGENEVWRECGPVCEWCGTLRCRELDCSYKCYCKEGYLRNDDGKCIPENECPNKLVCYNNEIVMPNGPADEFCLHSDTEEISNSTIEEEKCYCIDGYKRNIHGYCIDSYWCPVIQCPGMETYQPCPKRCNTTCRNYGDPDCKEDDQCYPGCFCPENYVMNDYRFCVPLEECPPGSNPFAPTVPPTVASPTKATTPSAEEETIATTTTAENKEVTKAKQDETTTPGDDEPVTAKAEPAEETTTVEVTTLPPKTKPPKKAKQEKGKSAPKKKSSAPTDDANE
ncbi:UNVERIFIED_CONTAM: Mucin-19 [Trichonephila clavipes]